MTPTDNFTTQQIEQTIAQMAEQIQAQLAENDRQDPLLIGIHTGGAWIGERIHQILQPQDPLGTLDISFYRDDFTRVGMNPQVRPSTLPNSVEDRHIILIDDVLYTGRTIRAALNEIFDYGRPASVTLAVLIDRGGRELPVSATIVGQELQLEPHEQIKLSGPEPLELTVVQSAAERD